MCSYIQIPTVVRTKLILFFLRTRRNSFLIQQPINRNHTTHYENCYEKGQVRERKEANMKKKRKVKAKPTIEAVHENHL